MRMAAEEKIVKEIALSSQHSAKPVYRKGREGRKERGKLNFCLFFTVFASVEAAEQPANLFTAKDAKGAKRKES
jgi:hypothetical protein